MQGRARTPLGNIGLSDNRPQEHQVFDEINNSILVYFLPLSDIQLKNITETKRQHKMAHSTETSLISTTDFILRTVDQKKITAVVYFDMNKAFESINHVILLKKTWEHRSISLCSPVVRKRYQAVRINSVLSDKLPVVNDVPRGSVLGAFLFSIYVNDLPNVCQNCSTACHVDDTKLLLSFTVNDSAHAI